MTHLWEIKHPYYCTASQYEWDFPSWDNYMSQIKEAGDLDYNFLVRFDWYDSNDPGWELNADQLRLTYVRQRRGELVTHDVTVNKSDEPAIREWLQIRWVHMIKTWSGVSDTVVTLNL